jgi:sterol desaturase/sphingolipid hydroxylase (fatty acid hydroxylase superfamily)
VRYGYAPFMMLGLTAAAYLVVSELVVARGNTWAYLLLIPLLAAAYLTAFGAERIAPFFEDWNDHHEHGDTKTTFFHIVVYEYQAIVGVALIPVICWLFPFQGLWPTHWPMWGQVIMAFIISDLGFMLMHYLSHRYAPLWRLHAVHHGACRSLCRSSAWPVAVTDQLRILPPSSGARLRRVMPSSRLRSVAVIGFLP